MESRQHIGNAIDRPPDLLFTNNEPIDWLDDDFNNDVSNDTSFSDGFSGDDYSVGIADLFVFDDLNGYPSKINFSTLVNLTSYYEADFNNVTSYINTNCTSAFNDTFSYYTECGSISSVDKDDSKNWWALILIVVPFLTIFGNMLVILAVLRERTLQTITNYFIVSLAVADLLVAMVVMPFAVYVLINGSWDLPAVVCDFYIAMDVTCSTSSIFNLVAISIDRYYAVTRPIEYAKHKNNRRVWSTILLVWLVSVAIGSPIVLGLNNTPDRQPELCLFYHTDFIIYSSLISFYIPCLAMVFLYYRIFSALREREKKKRAERKSKENIKSGCVIENIANTRSGYCMAKFAETALGAVALVAPNIEEPTNTASGSNEDEDETPLDPVVVISNDKSTEFFLATIVEEAASSTPSAGVSTISGMTSSTHTSKKERRNGSLGPRFYLRKTNKPSKKKGDKFAARKEKKATQTLAVVLGVFLFCWVPFFTCNTMDAVCSKLELDCQPGIKMFIFTSWLGYMNSFINPVIYTLFNPEFRKAFRKIISQGLAFFEPAVAVSVS